MKDPDAPAIALPSVRRREIIDMKRGLLLVVVTLVLLGWPVVVVATYQWYTTHRVDRVVMTAAELQRFSGIHRYVLTVPKERDGWFLGLARNEDGKRTVSGGSSVQGGETVTLLLSARDRDDVHLVIVDDNSTFWQSCRQPSEPRSISSFRMQPRVAVDEPLYSADRDSIRSDEPSDFEVSVSLTAPPAG